MAFSRARSRACALRTFGIALPRVACAAQHLERWICRPAQGADRTVEDISCSPWGKAKLLTMRSTITIDMIQGELLEVRATTFLTARPAVGVQGFELQTSACRLRRGLVPFGMIFNPAGGVSAMRRCIPSMPQSISLLRPAGITDGHQRYALRAGPKLAGQILDPAEPTDVGRVGDADAHDRSRSSSRIRYPHARAVARPYPSSIPLSRAQISCTTGRWARAASSSVGWYGPSPWAAWK